MRIKAKVSLFLGSRTYGPEDPPFEVDPRIGANLVKQGLAEPHIAVDTNEDVQAAVNPAQTRARKAITRRA